MIRNKKINRVWFLSLVIIMLYIVGCAQTLSEKPSPSPKAPGQSSKMATLPAPYAVNEAARIPSEQGGPIASGKVFSTKSITKSLGVEAAIEPVKSSLWEALRKEGGEAPGYGMYTYVLLPRIIQTKKIAKRYQKLLYVITGTTFNIHTRNAFLKKEINLFCIPTTKDYKLKKGKKYEVVTLENYNYELAYYLVSLFAKIIKDKTEISKKLNQECGPFLITIAHPIGNTKGSFPLLFADLSQSNSEAISCIIDVYKKYITSKRISTEKEFNPLKAKLLNYFINFSNDLVIATAFLIKLRPIM